MDESTVPDSKKKERRVPGSACVFPSTVRGSLVRTGRLVEQAKLLYSRTPSADPHVPIGAPAPLLAPPVPVNARPVSVTEHPHYLTHETWPADFLEVYKEAFHPQLPVIDLDALGQALYTAKYDVHALPPADRAVVAILAAWGSCFTDRPAVTGSRAQNPITLRDLLDPAVQVPSETGRERSRFVAFMLNRALEAVDEAGLMRKPTRQNCAALLVLDTLVSWNDDRREAGRFYLITAIEQLRALYHPSRSFSSPSALPLIPPNEPPPSPTSDPSYWLLLLRDAISAALGSRDPHLTDEAAAAMCPAHEVLRQQPLEYWVETWDPSELDGPVVAAFFSHLVATAKSAARLTAPYNLSRPLNSDAIEHIWEELSRSAMLSVALLDSAEQSAPQFVEDTKAVFRDLCTYRTQIAFALHRHIGERLATEQDSLVFESLYLLKQASNSILLDAILDLMRQCQSCDSHFVLSSLLVGEFFPLYLDHIVALPCDIEGGELAGWTLHAKVEVIQWLHHSLSFLAWSFPVTAALSSASSALSTLARLSPLPFPLSFPTPRSRTSSASSTSSLSWESPPSSPVPLVGEEEGVEEMQEGAEKGEGKGKGKEVVDLQVKDARLYVPLVIERKRSLSSTTSWSGSLVLEPISEDVAMEE
ncbi:hypothetical protein JCM8097_001077 [Rhodosporidiobolus ruineniae]